MGQHPHLPGTWNTPTETSIEPGPRTQRVLASPRHGASQGNASGDKAGPVVTSWALFRLEENTKSRPRPLAPEGGRLMPPVPAALPRCAWWGTGSESGCNPKKVVVLPGWQGDCGSQGRGPGSPV